MRYINWNINCKSNIDKIISLITSVMTSGDCIIALQEVMPKAAFEIRNRLGDDYNIEYSLDYRIPGEFDTNNRKLGVMILVSKDIKLLDSGVCDRSVFPDRTLFANVEYKGRKLKIVALHSLTGVSFKMAKAAQFRTWAEYVNSFSPDIVSFDANEPKVDHYDISEMKFFDQGAGDGRKGAKLFFETLENQGLRDVLVDDYDTSNYVAGEPLAVSHIIGSTGAKRRYDFVFAKRDMDVLNVMYLYEDAIAATSDHAMVVVDFKVY